MRLFLIGFGVGSVSMGAIWYFYAAKIRAAATKAENALNQVGGQIKKVI